MQTTTWLVTNQIPHKSILEKEGFKVDTYIHGLGENQNIRNLFVERANEAWDALEK